MNIMWIKLKTQSNKERGDLRGKRVTSLKAKSIPLGKWLGPKDGLPYMAVEWCLGK